MITSEQIAFQNGLILGTTLHALMKSSDIVPTALNVGDTEPQETNQTETNENTI